jgi:hypothetical protein
MKLIMGSIQIISERKEEPSIHISSHASAGYKTEHIIKILEIKQKELNDAIQKLKEIKYG